MVVSWLYVFATTDMQLFAISFSLARSHNNEKYGSYCRELNVDTTKGKHWFIS